MVWWEIWRDDGYWNESEPFQKFSKRTSSVKCLFDCSSWLCFFQDFPISSVLGTFIHPSIQGGQEHYFPLKSFCFSGPLGNYSLSQFSRTGQYITQRAYRTQIFFFKFKSERRKKCFPKVFVEDHACTDVLNMEKKRTLKLGPFYNFLYFMQINQNFSRWWKSAEQLTFFFFLHIFKLYVVYNHVTVWVFIHAAFT